MELQFPPAETAGNQRNSRGTEETSFQQAMQEVEAPASGPTFVMPNAGGDRPAQNIRGHPFLGEDHSLDAEIKGLDSNR